VKFEVLERATSEKCSKSNFTTTTKNTGILKKGSVVFTKVGFNVSDKKRDLLITSIRVFSIFYAKAQKNV